MRKMYLGQPKYVGICSPLVNEAHKVSKHTSACYYNTLSICLNVCLKFHWFQIYTLFQFYCWFQVYYGYVKVTKLCGVAIVRH